VSIRAYCLLTLFRQEDLPALICLFIVVITFDHGGESSKTIVLMVEERSDNEPLWVSVWD